MGVVVISVTKGCSEMSGPQLVGPRSPVPLPARGRQELGTCHSGGCASSTLAKSFRAAATECLGCGVRGEMAVGCVGSQLELTPLRSRVPRGLWGDPVLRWAWR